MFNFLEILLSALLGGSFVIVVAWVCIFATPKNKKRDDLPDKPIPMEHEHGGED